MAADILIKNGLIVDGTGKKAYKGNVRVEKGKVTGVGKVNGAAKRVIDADGLAVTPGFWDVHTHYDAQLLWDPIGTSSCWHGVTTVIMGNCGFTIAPVKQQDQQFLVKTLARVEGMSREVLERTLPWKWESFKQYVDTLESSGIGINAITQVGHTAIRRYVMGEESAQRAATPAEIDKMKQHIKDARAAGAMGFTTSRVSTHWDGDGKPVGSRLATMDEYLQLVEALKGTGKAGFIELAGGPEFNKYSEEGRQMFVELAKRSGLAVCWNAVSQAMDNPTVWRESLERMTEMREKEGYPFFALGHVQPDDFEFNLKFTNVFDRFETWQWVLLQPKEKKTELLGRPEIRAKLKAEVDKGSGYFSTLPVKWERIILVEAAKPQNKKFEMKTIVEIGKALGKHPMDAMFDMALEEDYQTQFRQLDSRNPDESVQEAILKWPHVVPGMSDAGAHLITEVNTGFPTKVLGYWVREKQALSLEEAIRRLASMPAEEIGVTDRGKLLEGQAADIVLFDPKTVEPSKRKFVNDLPGGNQRLVQYSTGMHMTIVNGQVVLEEGKDTGARSGRVLRCTDYS